MPTASPSIQTERAERLERELEEERRRIGAALRETRESLGLSLRDVAPKVKLGLSSLSLTERGEQWSTSTIKRLVRFYEKTAA